MFSSMLLIICTVLAKIVFLLFKKQTQQSVITNLSGKTTEKHLAHDYQKAQPHKTVLLKLVALQHFWTLGSTKHEKLLRLYAK